jgi:hypothetical protein
VPREWTVTGLLKELGGGIAVVGVLASAAAVLNLIFQLISSPASTWLIQVLEIYRGLFFPIINNTFGMIVRIFGYHLLPWAKDIIVLYFVIGSANGRASLKYQRKVGSVNIPILVTAVLIWPLLVMFTIFLASLDPIPAQRQGARGVMKTILLQAVYVSVVVICALGLHAAEILI